MASAAAVTRSLLWQQLGHGWKLGKTSGSQICRKHRASRKIIKKRRFPFSISWENTERRDKLICMCYIIARKYVGDLEGPGAI